MMGRKYKLHPFCERFGMKEEGHNPKGRREGVGKSQISNLKFQIANPNPNPKLQIPNPSRVGISDSLIILTPHHFDPSSF
jgi:hypothetical protein